MTQTLVLQSGPPGPQPDWIARCTRSVRHWAQKHHYDYEWVGDELFDHVPLALRSKLAKRPIIATDLARLGLLQARLQQSEIARVVWMDADFLIFAPDRFALPNDIDMAVGREVWVDAADPAKRPGLKVWTKVHNAFLMFSALADRRHPVLDHYHYTAQRLVQANVGRMPDQFIGPKLLTALHNVVQLPVLETAAMISPRVAADILQQGGPALDLWLRHSPQMPAAANVCWSSAPQDHDQAALVQALACAPANIAEAAGPRA